MSKESENIIIVSVWNKNTKQMSELEKKNTHVLNKENFVIRKAYCKDIEGNTIFEYDWILILAKNKFSEVSIIESGTAKNLKTNTVIENVDLWKNSIVVGNKFEGVKISKASLDKYNLIIRQEDNPNVKTKIEPKELSYEAKIEANICPDCDSKLVSNSGCKNCLDCGFSACSL